MARRVSEAQKRAPALQAGRRMIARGERPGYRLSAGQDGARTVVGLPGVMVKAKTTKAALTAAKTAIAAVLEVDPESFDLDA